VFLANYIVSDQAVVQNVPEWRGVRTARHTYVETLGREPWLLFDNVTDPYQLDSRVDDAALQADMRCELDKWLRCTRDPFVSSDHLIHGMGLQHEWRQREAEAARGWREK
jgi:hypothetical protein